MKGQLLADMYDSLDESQEPFDEREPEDEVEIMFRVIRDVMVK